MLTAASSELDLFADAVESQQQHPQQQQQQALHSKMDDGVFEDDDDEDLTPRVGRSPARVPVMKEVGKAVEDDDLIDARSSLDDGSSELGDGWLSRSISTVVPTSEIEIARLRELEEEQDRLNDSLCLLSSQFAQVQFRLRQINEAEGPAKEHLIKELHEFAFKGCADVGEARKLRRMSSTGSEAVLSEQRERQTKLIRQLKEQLEDLEQLAYDQGAGELPSALVIQKQKAVLEELQSKIQLNIQFDKMSQMEIQRCVDEALKQLVNPFKAKEQLVEQLQTQIVDLERYVDFLHREAACVASSSNSDSGVEEGASKDPNSATTGALRSIGYEKPPLHRPFSSFFGFGAPVPQQPSGGGGVATSSSASSGFQRNALKHTLKGNHYGDQRAELQLAIDAVVEVMKKYTLLKIDDPDQQAQEEELEEKKRRATRKSKVQRALSSEGDDYFEQSIQEVVITIRRRFCPALRALLEHGMQQTVAPPTQKSGILGCFPNRTRSRDLMSPTLKKTPKVLEHVWDVVLFFFECQQADGAPDESVRQLSQSFQLERVAGRSVTSKQALLSAIETIVTTHERLKRSKDAQWKAFVSAALNEKRLPAWMRMIFRSRSVVERCYFTWSYVARTGCEELYALFDAFAEHRVSLPVDLAIRPFEQMREIFG